MGEAGAMEMAVGPKVDTGALYAIFCVVAHRLGTTSVMGESSPQSITGPLGFLGEVALNKEEIYSAH